MVADMLLLVAGSGALGGVVNAALSDNGFILPRLEEHEHGYVIRPGAVGNLLTGAVSAAISWGLYGPLNASSIGSAAAPGTGLTLSAFVGALIVGAGGARWLTNEVDKRLLRAAVSGAVTAQPAEPALAAAMLAETPARALRKVEALKERAGKTAAVRAVGAKG